MLAGALGHDRRWSLYKVQRPDNYRYTHTYCNIQERDRKMREKDGSSYIQYVNRILTKGIESVPSGKLANLN